MQLLLVQVCSYGFTEYPGDNLLLLLRFNVRHGLSSVHDNQDFFGFQQSIRADMSIARIVRPTRSVPVCLALYTYTYSYDHVAMSSLTIIVMWQLHCGCS